MPEDDRRRPRALHLRPVSPTDYEEIYRWSTDPRTSVTWRYRGATPSPDVVVRQLWDGVLAQFCVISPERRTPVGIVGLYNANHVSQYAYLYALSAPEMVGTGLVARAALELIDHAFSTFRLRKIYIETRELALDQFRSVIRRGIMVEEGRLREHEWHEGGYDDLVFLSVQPSALDAIRRVTGRGEIDLDLRTHDSS
jgi:RimJ/RimL family protein N-acetyltransferase